MFAQASLVVATYGKERNVIISEMCKLFIEPLKFELMCVHCFNANALNWQKEDNLSHLWNNCAWQFGNLKDNKNPNQKMLLLIIFLLLAHLTAALKDPGFYPAKAWVDIFSSAVGWIKM